MQFYSTNNPSIRVNFKQAVMESMAPDKGLYMPTHIPTFDSQWVGTLHKKEIHEIGFEIARQYVDDDISDENLYSILQKTINFTAPLITLDDKVASLELWHGPTLAFKDFGARFMAGIMGHYNQQNNKNLTILVATSGDTGGAVAAGFYEVPGIEVIILYPSGKVSELQEKQLTTLGKNITALEINGSFDDCQYLVKEAFLDKELQDKFMFSSANSINIARLIPQTFYYFEGYKQIQSVGKKVIVSVPSGNFGNITAGILSKKMGLPIHKFIAATNINRVVPDYLQSGMYKPKPSFATISNAMDVGNPSNFVRLQKLYSDNLELMRQDIEGFYLNDDQTRMAMVDAYQHYGYICDPHGAIGYKALDNLKDDEFGIFLETAHPAKFTETVEETLSTTIQLPDRLLSLLSKPKESTLLNNDYETFKQYLLYR